MALSNKAKEAIRRAVTEDKAADELIAALEAAADEQAAAVAALGATSNLSALAPTAAALAAGSPSAAVITDSAGVYAIPAEPTGAEVDDAVDALRDKVETALDLKADQADLAQLVSDMNAALDLKADNADAETLRSQVESRMDAVEAKIDAVIAAFKASGQMASS